MDMVRYCVAGAALALAAPLQANSVEPWRVHIDEAARRTGIPAPWIERVMHAESAGRTHLKGRPITSPKGAMGLMQLMPGTWREMRARHGLGHDPHDPADNILAGAFYLKLLHARFGYPGLFAAYNAGPARYQRHLATGRNLPMETRIYLARVTETAPISVGSLPDARRPTLFFKLGDVAQVSFARALQGGPDGLFVPLSGQ